jgi:ribosomal protein S18 acetylase RimI-like enzyme
MSELTIRPATGNDLPVLGRLGAVLMRTHYAFDPQRFLAPADDLERGYAAFLATQLGRQDAMVLVAARGGVPLGYVYAGLEPLSWKELRGPAGFIHDIVVDDSLRRTGVARQLLTAAVDWLRARGAPRVVLWTASRNTAAQALFESSGFRNTMIEMTREL